MGFYFNPRTPCGVRHYRRHQCDCSRHFNPRTPCGVRLLLIFSNTAFFVFQSTHPMRGATTLTSLDIIYSDISIHAPHAGCDDSISLCRCRYVHFNPRTPCGVRRKQYLPIIRVYGISIHAPHAGCDWLNTVKIKSMCVFQSTHPMRGATWYFKRRIQEIEDFNPRTPCGVRQQNFTTNIIPN